MDKVAEDKNTKAAKELPGNVVILLNVSEAYLVEDSTSSSKVFPLCAIKMSIWQA